MALTRMVRTVAGLLFLTGCLASPPGDGAGGGNAGGSGMGGGMAGGGMAGGGATEIALADLCSTIRAADCAYFVRCGAYASVAACMTSLPAGANCPSGALAGADAGRVHYDGAKARQCVDGVPGAACDDVPFKANACSGIFVGQVPLNGACEDDSDCVQGAFCKGAGAFCGATCTTKVALGSPVSYPDECVDGASPFDGHCVTPRPLGASCDNPDGGGTGLPCAAPGFCYPFRFSDGGAGNLCARTGLLGEPCESADAGIASCNTFTQCNAATSTCAALSGNGGACNADNVLQCQFDLWCNGGQANPTCQSLSALGGPCVHDWDCAGDGLCNGGQPFNLDGGPWPLGQCVARPGMNEPCTIVCAAGLYCDTSGTRTCVPRKADGVECLNVFECTSNLCIERDAGHRVCGACQ